MENRFRFTLFLFKISGFPILTNDITILQRIYNLLVSLCAYSVCIGSIADVYMNSDDIKRMSTTLRLIFNMIMVVWIEIIIRFRMDKLKRIFHQIESFTWEEMPTRDAETGELTIAAWIPRMDVFLKRAILISTVSFLLQTSARIMTSKDFLFKAWYPFNVSVSPTYELIMITQIFAVLRLTITFFAFPHVFAYTVCIACTQLDKVKYSLKNIKQKIMESQYNSDKGKESNILTDRHMQDELNDIVRHHQEVMGYVRMLEGYMSLMMAGILFCILLSLCTAAFSAVLNIEDLTDMMQSIPAYMTAMIFAFLFCSFGTLLSEAYESVSDAAWTSNWVGSPLSYQKSISFIIAISKKGFHLTAGKIVPVSNATMMSMVNESMSLFMFLLTMKEKNDETKNL